LAARLPTFSFKEKKAEGSIAKIYKTFLEWVVQHPGSFTVDVHHFYDPPRGRDRRGVVL
jgi:hypothetical protein